MKGNENSCYRVTYRELPKGGKADMLQRRWYRMIDSPGESVPRSGRPADTGEPKNDCWELAPPRGAKAVNAISGSQT